MTPGREASPIKTVLIFSRYFPPMFSVGGKRAFRFARYLPRYGWRPVVVTAPVPPGRPQDPTAGLPLDPSVIVLRSYYPDLSEAERLLAHLRPRRGGGLSDGTVAGPIRERTYPPPTFGKWLAWQAQIPVASDVFVLPWWVALARRLARRFGADAIFATSSPYSALLLGAAARRVTGLPLCLDIRDPWSLNFGQHRKPPWVRASERWIEERVLGAADRVTFTCESVVSAYRSSYPSLPESRFSCIHNSFDPEQAPAGVAALSGPVTVVHFGNVYGGRTLAPVIRALARLRRARELGPEDLIVRNLGRVAETDLELMRELGVSDLFRHEPFVPYAEGLRILAEADVLLLLAYGDETLFVPAKLYDYFLAGRPILCFSPPSELTRIIDETRSGVSLRGDDIEGTARFIERALAARQGLSSLPAPDQDSLRRFSAPHTAARLAELLDDMIRG